MKYGRFIPAAFLALTLHIGLLITYVSKNTTVILPDSFSVQRIAVSLGGKVEKTPPEHEDSPRRAVEPLPEDEVQETVQKKEKQTPEKLIEKRSVKNVPAKQPHPAELLPAPRVIKPERIHKRIISHKENVHQPSPSSLPEENKGEEASPVENAAKIIQKASPLYQINPPPEYPKLARRRGYEGVVMLEVSVDDSGYAYKVIVLLSSGHSLLDKAALKAVRNWRFQPGTLNGLPQAMNVQVPVRFRLKDL